MVDIGSVGNLPLQPSRVERSSRSPGAASKPPVAGESSAGDNADSIEISAGAKKAQTVSRLVEAAQSSPPVRADAVEQARETLAQGGYEGEEVSREAARRIADELLGM